MQRNEEFTANSERVLSRLVALGMPINTFVAQTSADGVHDLLLVWAFLPVKKLQTLDSTQCISRARLLVWMYSTREFEQSFSDTLILHKCSNVVQHCNGALAVLLRWIKMPQVYVYNKRYFC